MKLSRRPIVVGMSGGVDSSVALLLLRRQGWDPIGLSLRQPLWEDSAHPSRGCVHDNTLSLKIAGEVCRSLAVPHHIIDVSPEFKKEVVGYFFKKMAQHRTPNPCVFCNRHFKIARLLAWARRRGIRHVATGHYARVRRDPGANRYELLKARDTEKDQTYPLCFLSQEQLRHLILPLGSHTKQEIYHLARENGFEFFQGHQQSQDFCYVAASSMGRFLRKEVGTKPGPMMDLSGSVLGEHQGLHFYTIGQRKGLGLSGGPFFVISFDTVKNVLFVSKDPSRLMSKEAVLFPCNFPGGMPVKPLRVQVKIRYRQHAARATLFPLSARKAKVFFDRTQRAVTPGQFAVFYRRAVCLGGGEILPHSQDCGKPNPDRSKLSLDPRGGGKYT
ncbi:MAG: tRNA 2-thiouridine(34) synthase MnmA [Candidatus Omnitrophica bacterium]|nr:tRNA 2-thiouridine(34) synthase MnmA [Candidatus Omnitrophota bacterium]